MALSREQVESLLSGTRTKGQYITYLNEFIESGEEGECANEKWVDLAQKKAATLKQGFESAKDNKLAHEDAQYVKVIMSGDKEDAKVYLINLKVAGVTDVPVEDPDEEMVA